MINHKEPMKMPITNLRLVLFLAVGCYGSGCASDVADTVVEKTPTQAPLEQNGVVSQAAVVERPQQLYSQSVGNPAEVATTERGSAEEAAETAEGNSAAEEAEILPAQMPVSPELQEVIDLARSGVTEEVLVAYVEASDVAYELDADEILFLNDVGVPSMAITAMIRHGANLREKALVERMEAENSGNVSEPIASAPVSRTAEASAATEGGVSTASVSVPPPMASAPQEVTYFYDDLAPYGNWINIEGYGWCWRPSVAVVQVGWRPYHDRGRWLYTNGGWYWQSDYTWGATVFHYGRWWNHPHFGWCWYPGLEWGPSWVTWRVYGDYCGWAPLPPYTRYVSGVGFYYRGSHVGFSFGFGLHEDYYTFIPYRYFHHHHPYRYYVHHGQARHRTIYNESTVVNNYIVGDNNVIINKGIDVDVVRRESGENLRKVAIRDLPAAGTQVKPDRLEVRKGEPVIYRTALAETPESVPKVAALDRGAQEARKPAAGAAGASERIPTKDSLGGKPGSGSVRLGNPITESRPVNTPGGSTRRSDAIDGSKRSSGSEKQPPAAQRLAPKSTSPSISRTGEASRSRSDSRPSPKPGVQSRPATNGGASVAAGARPRAVVTPSTSQGGASNSSIIRPRTIPQSPTRRDPSSSGKNPQSRGVQEQGRSPTSAVVPGTVPQSRANISREGTIQRRFVVKPANQSSTIKAAPASRSTYRITTQPTRANSVPRPRIIPQQRTLSNTGYRSSPAGRISVPSQRPATRITTTPRTIQTPTRNNAISRTPSTPSIRSRAPSRAPASVPSSSRSIRTPSGTSSGGRSPSVRSSSSRTTSSRPVRAPSSRPSSSRRSR